MREKLEFVYGQETGEAVYEELQALARQYAYLRERQPLKAPAERLTERDVILITYGDQVQSESASPLQTLHLWLKKHLQGIINTVHILPFYPYTSDDGFSVVDYWQVDQALGQWEDIRALHTDFRLMFDAVINHISASSEWFQKFLAGDPHYRDYFIVTDPSLDLSQVTRPRALPLLTRFQTAEGEKYLWTTFSTDQIDLNFKNPAVLLKICELLLFYISQGADLIRLDAIGYMWKEVGTSCIHLPQTHALIQVMRELLDSCAPNTLLITETNVPHKDNVSYFGNGSNEAQLVYQFSLVPLVLNALYSGSAGHLQAWAAGLEKLSDTTTFFNFLASHDGIGVVPAKAILDDSEISQLVERTLAHGGQVSYKNNPDGSQSPYELNITYFDALSNPEDETEDEATRINRFVVSQAIMLAMQGVPGIYFHSLLGSHNWQAGFAETGRNRTLNREKLQRDALEKALSDPESHSARVFARYKDLISKRTAQPAFHPNAAQAILTPAGAEALFIIERTSTDGSQKILAIHNLSSRPQQLQVASGDLNLAQTATLSDLISGQNYRPEGANLNLGIEPYQVLWLVAG
ncbi:MAG TPA: alpha-amylase family glycosyl hydrolase [Chloroflexia bacterium]|nr:alpha-amylase family glycosyl hydrolase [Chloroflexia bacterium]